MGLIIGRPGGAELDALKQRDGDDDRFSKLLEEMKGKPDDDPKISIKKSSEDDPDASDAKDKPGKLDLERATLQELLEFLGLLKSGKGSGSGGGEGADPSGGGGSSGGKGVKSGGGGADPGEGGGSTGRSDPVGEVKAESLDGKVKFYGEDAQEAKKNFDSLYESDPDFKKTADQVIEKHGSLNVTTKDLADGTAGVGSVDGNDIALDTESASSRKVLAHELLHNAGLEHGSEMDRKEKELSDMV